MKFLKYNILLAIIGSLIYSCDLKDIDGEIKWSNEAKVFITPIDNQSLFYSTNDNVYVVDQVDYELSIETGELENFEPKSVEIYAYVEENTDGDIVSYGDATGKKIAEITEFSDNKGQFSLSIDQINELYSADLLKEGVGPDDLIELKYVITGDEGLIYDTRFDCNGGHCQEIVQIEKGFACGDNFEGVYHYEVIENEGWASATVGDMGTITIDRISLNGLYQVSDAHFGTHWLGTYPQEMHEEGCEGFISFPNDGANGIAWEFRNFDGASVEIIVTEKWWDRYVAWWGYAWYVVRITRESGEPISVVAGAEDRVLAL